MGAAPAPLFRTAMPTLRLLPLLLAFVAGPALAEGGDDPHKRGGHASRHLAVFAGVADPAHHAAVALGADAEWRLPILGQRVGAAAFGDVALGHHAHGLIGGGVVVHPGAGLRVFAGPAVALSEGHRELGLRAGLGYDVHVGRYAVTPTVNVDVVGGTATPVAGLSFGASF